MGLLDFLRGVSKKQPRLDSGKEIKYTGLEDGLEQYVVDTPIQTPKPKKTEDEIKDFVFSPDTQTMAFSEANPETGEIEIKLKRQALSGKTVELATLIERCDKETLKYLVKALDMCLDEPRTRSGLNPETIKYYTDVAKSKLDDLIKKHNIAPTAHLETALDYIDVKTQLMVFPEATLDYKNFEKQLPKIIDVSELSYEEIMQYGDGLSARLDALKTITSPESAYLHRDSLISFMRYKEQESQKGKLIAMMPSIEDAENSPENQIRRDTIAECADAIEPIQNEDSLLYSAYLKLEEKRILNRLQSDIKKFQLTVGTDTDQKLKELENTDLNDTQKEVKSDLLVKKDRATYEQAQEIVELLESDKIHPVSDVETKQQSKNLNHFEIQNEVVGYMVGLLVTDSVSAYIDKGLKHDIKTKSFIARHPEIANSKEASEYLSAKMRSTGQVSNIDKPGSLREFIETTDYKGNVGTEIPSFLLSVAQMEEAYISQNYAPIINAYQKQIQKQQQAQARSTGAR